MDSDELHNGQSAGPTIMIRSIRLRIAICWGFLSALTGCGITTSVHPVSTEETSIVDERLIGVWQVTNNVGNVGAPPKKPTIIIISRDSLQSKSNRMVLTAVDEKKDNLHLVGVHMQFFALPGQRNYASFHFENGTFLITEYFFSPDGRRLKFRRMKDKAIQDAIDQRKLKGVVRRPPAQALKPGQSGPTGFRKVPAALITCNSLELRTYLDAHPNCFTQDMWQLHKLTPSELQKALSVQTETPVTKHGTDLTVTPVVIVSVLVTIGLIIVAFFIGLGFGKHSRSSDPQN